MGLKSKIDADLKAAMLAGDKLATATLRGLKSSILNAELEAGKRDGGLTDEEIITVVQREVKRRQESAHLYRQGGREDKASVELAEKDMLARYLPQQLSEAAIAAVIDKVIGEVGASDARAMGQVIGRVRQELGARADGAIVARLVREKLS